ncbi:MAG: tryptophan--tRNA ligase [Candidatus Hydrogenedentes bacterium]|nr:tryptophan--tRNA ligase [Candidatus Hydrogenedentota bacterium]
MGEQRKKRVFSGIQPSGRPHLGNYLGAIKQYVAMQDEYDSIYGIVDYHALTSMHDREQLAEYTLGVAIDFLACGLDPDKCLLVKQSDIPEHTELAWLLGTVTPIAWLERVPTFKDKKAQQPQDVNFGLMAYPVLMAADIVIYKSEAVPVGRDQLPHLELTREIVRAFNYKYGEVFPEPASLVQAETAVVLGIDGEKKMSKSLDNDIGIFEEPESLKKSVRKMVTDTQKIYQGDPGRPEICNVQSFHRMFGFPGLDEVERDCRSGKLGCGKHKDDLAAMMADYFAPMRERRKELETDLDYVRDVIETGGRKARERAQATMAEVRDAMGLDISHLFAGGK